MTSIKIVSEIICKDTSDDEDDQALTRAELHAWLDKWLQSSCETCRLVKKIQRIETPAFSAEAFLTDTSIPSPHA